MCTRCTRSPGMPTTSSTRSRRRMAATCPIEERAVALADFGDRFFADLEAGRSDDPVLKAVVHTVRAFDIDTDGVPAVPPVDDDGPHDHVVLHVGRSARVHGRLGRGDRRLDAADPRTERLRPRPPPRARSRDRVPADQFPARHRRGPRSGPAVPAARRHDEVRCRPHRPPRRRGIRGVDAIRDRALPRAVPSRPTWGSICSPNVRRVASARRATLYSRILDRIEAQHYDVFTERASVSTFEKARLVGQARSAWIPRR